MLHVTNAVDDDEHKTTTLIQGIGFNYVTRVTLINLFGRVDASITLLSLNRDFQHKFDELGTKT